MTGQEKRKGLSQETKRKIEELVKSSPAMDAVLLPALNLAQEEFGYVSQEVMEHVADALGLPRARVASVVTFYTLFHQKPVGKYHIQVCANLSCSLSGAGSLLEHLKKRLKIDVGETTPDGKWSLATVECLGSCGTAPAMQINEVYYEDLTAEKIESILRELEQKDDPVKKY